MKNIKNRHAIFEVCFANTFDRIRGVKAVTFEKITLLITAYI